MNLTAEAAQSLAIRFGPGEADCRISPEGIEVQVPLPILSGPPMETIISWPFAKNGLETTQTGRFATLRHEHGLAGVAVCPVQDDLESQTYHCYRELFAILKGQLHAYRIWHYVPQINEATGGMENYRIFNIGRRRAFDDHFGSEAEAQMPAASAVGTPDAHLVLVFVAGKPSPRYLENPQQTPAYHYPDDYGPKSPSFARAAITERTVYISGTASIRGHKTVHEGDLERQVAVTVENMSQLSKALGLPSWKSVTQRPGYRLKVYLRHRSDLDRLRPLLDECLGATEANTTVLHTDICRADLDVEIEAVFSSV